MSASKRVYVVRRPAPGVFLTKRRGESVCPPVDRPKTMSIRFVIALALFNMTSVRAARVLLTLYAIKLDAEPIAIGMLAAAFSVFPVLLSWQSGRLSDRFGSRWLLLFGIAGSAGGMLLPHFMPSMTTIFIAGVLSGLSMTFCNVSLQNLVGLLSAAD